MIGGNTKVCGIIGNPVEHTMSPLMQNFYAKKTGADFVYAAFRVDDESVEDAVRGAYALNMAGMNVTVPHKQRVMEYLVETDGAAKVIGAVNTLVRTEGGFKGYNTDAAGLLRAMKEEEIGIQGVDCILLGAGGAAKAAAYVLVKGGARVVYILNRNLERASLLADEMNHLAGRNVAVPMSVENYRKLPRTMYLAVQTTSVGMHPNAEASLIDREDFYEMIHTGLDVIYTPAETKFMRGVRAAGGRAVGGLSMLLYQGIIAFELWNPDVNVDSGTVLEARELLTDKLMGRI